MFVGSLGPSRDFSEGPKPTTGVSPQASVQERARLDPQGVKTGPNGMTIRGVTYYKSDHMVADDGEPGENCESWNTRVVVTTASKFFRHWPHMNPCGLNCCLCG